MSQNESLEDLVKALAAKPVHYEDSFPLLITIREKEVGELAAELDNGYNIYIVRRCYPAEFIHLDAMRAAYSGAVRSLAPGTEHYFYEGVVVQCGIPVPPDTSTTTN